MKSKALKRILSYIGHYKGQMTGAVICAIISTAFTVLAPSILGDISTILYEGVSDGLWFLEDGVYTTIASIPLGKIETITFIVILLCVLYLIAWLFAMIANKLFASIASKVVRDLRADIDEKMHRMKLNYYDTRTNGEILSVVQYYHTDIYCSRNSYNDAYD